MMRIVNRAEFLKLPTGTVYSFYESLGMFKGLFVKHYTLCNDWIYQDLLECVESADDKEFMDIMTKAEEDGSTFRNDLDCLERDGMYEENQLFAVYDQEDVLKLVDTLKKCL